MFIKTAFLVILGLFFLCCKKAPDYPVEPNIKFLSVTRYKKTVDQDEKFNNNIQISIKYEDGDGDIGVTQTDASNPKYSKYYTQTILDIGFGPDTTYKLYNYNIDMFLKKNGMYEKIIPIIPFGGTLEPLISYNEVGPIEGVLNYDINILFSSLSQLDQGFVGNDTVRFEVFIVDRAPHESNKITTDDIVVFPK